MHESATHPDRRNHRFFDSRAVGNDNDVAIWRIDKKCATDIPSAEESEDVMLSALQEFVSYKTISSRPEFAEDCHRGATFLGSLFKRLGGQVDMLSCDSNPHNPVVLAQFNGTQEPSKKKRILFYGHYDVVTADAKKSKWNTDPFQMKGINGYLYGRGVSDNKGPIIAALYAVTDLLQAKKLENDVVFLIEGEEESASRGFKETVREYKELIGKVDYILLANSYWLDDEVPCLTYGLRGVLHATVCVESPLPDLHSGVDGSYMNDEPLSDLTSTLSKLKGAGNRVMVPGFYDNILPVTPVEETRYDEIASLLMKRKPERGPEAKLKQALMARWREPNLTIHRYKVSGPDGSLVSSHASANISLRLVPGQEVDDVITSLTAYLEAEFATLNSENKMTVKVDNKAEPWLGNPNNVIFRTLEEAVMKAWAPAFAPQDGADESSEDESSEEGDDVEEATPGGAKEVRVSRPKKPLYIREGGSIPAIRFLEKEFGAPAAHLPCGQATDSAHLDNERLRRSETLKVKPRLIIHGGAGNITHAYLQPKDWEAYRKSLLTILAKTNTYMTTRLSTGRLPSALETATHAVSLLENDPLYNSGHGATLFSNDTTGMRDAALASGAQVVSTDFQQYGMSSPSGVDYAVRLEGGRAARCNPVVGQQCVVDKLEPESYVRN
ncbi:hypothetical protein BN1723_012779 [Verticillium longisporum]|uniref:Peptidase M20 dimerisation domain-containing protein n=1 Tax=Verticillium longisporum TaxID=100787 RepID=A0A0G4LLF1_VERLO|nr:hypothetical protein BN1723_012779 [Verticillium longisporum]